MNVIDRRSELLTLAEQIVTLGTKQADQIEVFVQDSKETNAEVALGQMKTAVNIQEAGAAIRCVVDKRLGCAFTNRVDSSILEKTLHQAIAAAKTSTPDETWSDLPMKASYSKVSEVWDEATSTKSPSFFVDMLADMTRNVTDQSKDVIVGQAGIGGIYGWSAYANSNGVSVADRSTRAYVYAGIVAPTPAGGMTPTIVEFDLSRSCDLDVDGVVTRAIRFIELAKKPAKGATGSKTVILIGNAFGNLLYFSFFPSIRGENVVREKSVLASRQDEQIASKDLSLIDDGLLSGGFRTSLFDDEGVPRQTTSIIEKGELRSFLWNNYWAKRYGGQSTGNAQRNLRTGVVGIQPSTITVPAGKGSLEELIHEVDSGYLIKGLQGAHSSNQDTGDFSVVGNPCFRIEDGQLTGCVPGLMLAGNAFQLIQKVEKIGEDNREFFIPNSSFYSPSIRFTDLQVIAKGD
jgi:PmbA protein